MKKLWCLLSGIILTALTAGLSQLAGAVEMQLPSSQENEDVIVAKVGEKTVTLKDVEMRMFEIPPLGIGDPATQRAERKKKTVEKIVGEMIFYQGAIAEGIDKDPEIAVRVENYKRDLVVAAYKNKLREKVKPASIEEAKAYYEKNKSKYSDPAQIKMRQIVVKTEEEAKEILSLLRQGKDFASLAKEKSIDEMSKTRGGEIGWFSADMPIPYFADEQVKKLTALKKGEIAPIIQSGFGFHIIKIDDIKPETQRSYDMVAETVKIHYFDEELKKVEEKTKSELKAKMKVEIYYDKLK
ncbi:MAG: peptidyl-prolyl cis-trans isomerase [bacterium]